LNGPRNDQIGAVRLSETLDGEPTSSWSTSAASAWKASSASTSIAPIVPAEPEVGCFAAHRVNHDTPACRFSTRRTLAPAATLPAAHI
jgi:hypothetical protein